MTKSVCSIHSSLFLPQTTPRKRPLFFQPHTQIFSLVPIAVLEVLCLIPFYTLTKVCKSFTNQNMVLSPTYPWWNFYVAAFLLGFARNHFKYLIVSEKVIGTICKALVLQKGKGAMSYCWAHTGYSFELKVCSVGGFLYKAYEGKMLFCYWDH